jgi:NAD(P)-dependent dehydrogenase (short-subunit alcohol dehydrogenase family)
MNIPTVRELLDLNGSVVLVTGASGNIGAGIARRLSEAGASVALHCARDREGADALARELGERAYVVQGDVQRDAERLCDETIGVFSRLDALVNNAGIQPVKPLLEITENDLREMLRVNLEGVIALTAAASRRMVARGRGGAIVNLSSIEGLQPTSLGSTGFASTPSLPD